MDEKFAADREALIQNLIDAGCDRDLVHGFLNCIKAGDIRGGALMLESHRAGLLDRLHSCQRKIDCLDYLLYRLKKQCGCERRI